MALILIKITAIPLLLWMVMIVTRRFGSLIGGVVSGLPLTSATISFFMAIEQGADFAYRAAWGAFQGILAYIVFGLLFIHASRRFHWMFAFMLAVVGFFLASWASVALPIPTWIWIPISAAAMVLGVRLMPPIDPNGKTVPASQYKKPPYLQMVSGSVLTLLITTIANHVGPTFSGILLFFPVIGGVLGIFYLKNQYSNAAIQLYKGAFLGKLTGWTFMLTLLIALPYTNIAVAYSVGLISAGFVSVIFVKRARKPSC
ncbi:MAG: hypothetical protein J6V64_04340 [Burkholderiaceae bacterium]|nr:hypothetical protein [Burkholderiaceae bacterium]